jgi:hypothetical protein
MDKEQKRSAAQKAKAAIEDSFGSPPGDKTPHGQGRPARDPNVRHGTLTAADAKGVPGAQRNRHQG